CSSATLRPTGVARTPSASAAAFAACLDVNVDVDVGVDVDGDGDGDVAVDAALPASSSRAIGPPTVTTAPSFATCSTRTPALGEGISVFALSVAISTNGSSRSTFCPGRAFQ